MQVLTYTIGEDRRSLKADLESAENFVVDWSHATVKNWVQAREFERGMRQVEVHLKYKDGTPFDLTATSIWFEGLTHDLRKILDAHGAVPIDPANGIFRFDFPAQAFATAGSYKQAFFRVVKSGDSIATLEFDLTVLADMVIGGLVPSDYVTPLEDIINQMNVKKSEVEQWYILAKQELGDLEAKIKQDGLLTKADFDSELASSNLQKEVIDARKPAGKDPFDTVGARLDAMDEITDELNGSINTTLLDYFESETDEIGGAIPSYYQDTLNTMSTIPSENFNIGFITDDHLQMDDYAPNSLAHYAYISAASRRARLDAIIAGGDNINGWYAKDELSYDTAQAIGTLFGRADDNTDVFCLFGNHDLGYDQNANTLAKSAMTKDEIKTIYGAKTPMYGEVRDGDSLYGYKDYTSKKIRVIWLDAFDLLTTPKTDGTYPYSFFTQSCFSGAQLSWLAKTALMLPDKTWQVMIFSHAPISGSFDATEGNVIVPQYNTAVLIGILTAFQKGGTYSATTEDAAPVTITCDFANQGSGVLIAFISGHVHQDGQMMYQGINCIETACSLCNSTINPDRVANSETEDCWDIFSVNTAGRSIHAYRFGYGSDRNFSY